MKTHSTSFNLLAATCSVYSWCTSGALVMMLALAACTNHPNSTTGITDANSRIATALVPEEVADISPVEPIPFEQTPLLPVGNTQPQRFTLSADTLAVIKGQYGTVVAIPPRSLVHEGGAVVSGAYTLYLREAFRPAELINLGVDSKIKDEAALLAFSGVCQIEAFQDGKQLQVAQGAALPVLLPRSGSPDGYHLYHPTPAGWVVGNETSFTLADTLAVRFARQMMAWAVAAEGAPGGRFRPFKNERQALTDLRKTAQLGLATPASFWLGEDFYVSRAALRANGFSRSELTTLWVTDSTAPKLRTPDLNRRYICLNEALYACDAFLRQPETHPTMAATEPVLPYKLRQLGRFAYGKLAAQASGVAPQQYTGRIAGLPKMGRAVVHILGGDDNTILTVQTDENGKYSFHYLPGQSFSVVARYGKGFALETFMPERHEHQLPELELQLTEAQECAARIAEL